MIGGIRRPGAFVFLVGISQITAVSPCHAQTSLGGYGSGMPVADPSMSATAPLIPYSGTFSGFMPIRMGSSSLAFRPRDSARIGSNRARFSLAPMASSTQPMGGGLLPRSRSLLVRPGSMRQGGMTRIGRGRSSSLLDPPAMGVMPPSLAYPFYQPPPFPGTYTAPGMSM